MDRDVDRLAKFAEMMLGQLKSARSSADALAQVHEYTTGTEVMMREQSMRQFDRLIQIGEDAVAPFRSELAAQ